MSLTTLELSWGRIQKIEEIAPDLYVGWVGYGKKPKVFLPTVFRLKEDNKPIYLVHVRKLSGYRKGLVEVYSHIDNDYKQNLQATVDSLEKAYEWAVKIGRMLHA